MIRTLTLSVCVAAASLLAAGSTLANGGGGSGGGSMPSSSAPSYDPVAEYQKGATALQAKDWKEAEKAFAKVVAVAAKAAPAWYGLGRARMELGDFKGARKAFEKALKYEPDDIVTHAQFGVLMARMGETAKAQAELDQLKARAATCAGTCPDARALKMAADMVQAAMALAPASAGMASLDLLFAGPAAGDASYGQAIGLINEKRYGEALEALDEARKAFGPHPDVLTYIGYTHRRMGELDVAEDYYRQALAVAPEHRGALEYYGELKVEEGDIAGARLLLARLERACAFGCEGAEELRRWIDAGGEPR